MQLPQFHILLSVRFLFGYCLCQSRCLFSQKSCRGDCMSVEDGGYIYIYMKREGRKVNKNALFYELVLHSDTSSKKMCLIYNLLESNLYMTHLLLILEIWWIWECFCVSCTKDWVVWNYVLFNSLLRPFKCSVCSFLISRNSR